MLYLETINIVKPMFDKSTETDVIYILYTLHIDHTKGENFF